MKGDSMQRHLFAMTQPLSLARAAGVLSLVVSALTLLGWLIGIDALIRVLPGLAPMTPATALCFLLCGSSLLLQCGESDDVGRRRAARVMALAAGLIGSLVLAKYLTGWNPGLDAWLFREALTTGGLPHPGRMTQAAAFNFTLIGLALAFLDFEPRRGFLPAQHAALLASLIGLIAMLGYAYGVSSLSGFFAYTSMALHTAFVFTFLGLGVMMARPDKGLMSVTTSFHVGGSMARRLLPAAVLLPAVLGWLRLRGELLGWYNARFGLALLTAANIITFVILVWFTARRINRMDSKRRRAHEAVVDGFREIRQANIQLQRESTEHLRTEKARLRMEHQLHHSQKMESLGTLAGGIAHDFNNILTAVLLNADRARKKLTEDHPARKNLEEISKASARAADLVRRIMTFGRQDEPKLKTIHLRESVEDSLQLLRLSLPSNVQLLVDISGDLPAVAADATQIHQILLNLGTNAIHAMEETGGILDIKLETVFVTLELSRILGDLREGPHVRLSVGDSGKGMEKAVLDRVFDPFFTTKPPGVGTGLGLSVVHGIMKLHGGCVTAYSEPGRGTVFHLYFPAAAAASGDTPYVRQESPPGRGERLLCVDDDVAILGATAEMLEGLGYTVTPYSDPRAALENFRTQPADFDLLLTDLSMPGMSGIELAREVLGIRPGLAVVLSSGYISHLDAEKVRAAGVHAIVQKPNLLDEMGIAIRRALEATPRAPSGD
jgi:signal transduction histidine kinase/CheY-like chemotaxis protein